MSAKLYKESLKEIDQLVRDEKYKAAHKLIEEIPKAQSGGSLLLFYKAVCIYEDGDDLECLRLLRAFLNREPTHVKRNYSIFTAAICLINLGLEEEAMKLFEVLPSTYPDLEKELKRTAITIERKAEARKLFNGPLVGDG